VFKLNTGEYDNFQYMAKAAGERLGSQTSQEFILDGAQKHSRTATLLLPKLHSEDSTDAGGELQQNGF
jgi:hypothetical protein